MKLKFILLTVLLSLCVHANAEWFLRGTNNSWGATQMQLVATNTMQLKGVVFSSAGSFKFDRFGDWKENYGISGISSGNIPIAAGTWDITFFIDTKNRVVTLSALASPPPVISSSSQATSSASSAPISTAKYHIRGTFNQWLEGMLMSQVDTDQYEICINFAIGSLAGGSRFKIDPNGGWGDALPAADFLVSPTWTKVSFNSTSKAIFAEQNLLAGCANAASSSSFANSSVVSLPIPSSSSVSSSVARSSLSSMAPAPSLPPPSSSSVNSGGGTIAYHLRGTFNAWAEGTLMNRIGGTDSYEFCANFIGTGTRFKIDPNGGWNDAIPAADFIVAPGWVKIQFNSTTKAITVQQNLVPNCTPTSGSSSSSNHYASSDSSSSVTTYHLRGTNNKWAEGLLMNRMGSSRFMETCVKFVGGDINGGPRFRVDPNGGWGGDVEPSMSDAAILIEGWAHIIYDPATGGLEYAQGQAENCGNSSSSSSTSSVAAPSAPFSAYHLRGTNNNWLEGTLMQQIGTTDSYEVCANFTAGDAKGGPRFKVDPNGGWSDAIPTTNDISVPLGWVKISFNSTTKAISIQPKMFENCGLPIYNLVGTFNNENLGDIFEFVNGPQPLWKICRDFGTAVNGVTPGFIIIPNGSQRLIFPDTHVAASGWTYVVIDEPNRFTVTTDMAPNCSTQSTTASVTSIINLLSR